MTDPFERDDAAYVLGALSPAEREAFEHHLRSCTACVARVAEIGEIPGLLAGVDATDVTRDDPPVPDTLLPLLLREAARRRRRASTLVGALATLAAACVITLTVMIWPASGPTQQRFVAIGRSPVIATAALTERSWGTSIDVSCRYAPGSTVPTGPHRAFVYDLVVYDRRGRPNRAGSWTVPPDGNVDVKAGTSLPRAQISWIGITLPNGTPVLSLTP